MIVGVRPDRVPQARPGSPAAMLVRVGVPVVVVVVPVVVVLVPVVVLVLSTYEAAEYGPQAAEVGAAGFIPKSEFSPERLEEAWSAAKVPS